jgi:sn-glycerol 3-phosphate transport system substrate-binding protein
MPFTMEIPLLYYNKVTFREVGLDPEKPPKDLEELREYSEKILKRDGSGNVVRSGIALDIARWPERVLAEHGDYWVDNENGREGRATKVLFDNDTGRYFFEWWGDMIDKGLAFNVGRNPSGADALLAIAAARAEMAFANTGALRSVVDALEAGIEGVEVGISRLPGVPGGAGQTAVTSYGLWILNVRPQQEQEAAWKFIQWMVQPEQQAEWFAGSGYLPISRSSVDLPAAQAAVAKYPLFGQALDIYLEAPASPSAVTAALGPVKDVDEAVWQAIEAMVSGAKDPEQALEDAAAEGNEAISEYNRRIGD